MTVWFTKYLNAGKVVTTVQSHLFILPTFSEGSLQLEN